MKYASNMSIFHWILIGISSCQLFQTSLAEQYGECGVPVSKLYLSGLLATEVNNFVPMVYYEGSSTKFISTTGQTTIEYRNLCVDGNSYNGEISLYDDGTHGDDFANDGVFTRGCVHLCVEFISFDDFFGYAMEEDMGASRGPRTRIVVIKKSLQGTVPYETIETPLTPDVTVIASSHAFFFADVKRKYYPNFPASVRPNDFAAPTGKSVAVAALVQVFGDVFDWVTHTNLEESPAIGGGIYKWHFWDRRGGPSSWGGFGKIPGCAIALSGVPVYRIAGIIGNRNIISGYGYTQNHELTHGISGFEYHNTLNLARAGDRAHYDAACTGDHSSLQGPVWHWVKGYPNRAANGKQGQGVRLVENDDCKSCPDDKLTECCSFRYEDMPLSKAALLEKPELYSLSPLLMYIAGIMKPSDMKPEDKIYYCIGSDERDFGCGTSQPDQKPCTTKVDDSDKSKITADYVTRFTLEDVIEANGGRRYPTKKNQTIRHASILLSNRLPAEAEIIFFTLLWRHHEAATEPWERKRNPNYQPGVVLLPAILPWNAHARGNSILHSRLHGIDCGIDNIGVASCSNNGEDVCANAPCGDGAICKNLDGKALCMCREGLVGDGAECAFPEETDSYKATPSAYSAGSGCFPEGNVWTDFTDEGLLPPYPGGVAPYSANSCGSAVCAPGWKCNEDESKCIPPTSKDMCQGHGYSRSQCNAIGCCVYKSKKRKCKKKRKIVTCPIPIIQSDTQWSCCDMKTCCYWPCEELVVIHNGNNIAQISNCGEDCTTNILPDVNGYVHWELYLAKGGYTSGHKPYQYGKGPLKLDGPNLNMFDRCNDECFAGGDVCPVCRDEAGVCPTENPEAKFLLTPKQGTRKCKWLMKKTDSQIKKVCTLTKYNNLSKWGYESSSQVCRETCKPFLGTARGIFSK